MVRALFLGFECGVIGSDVEGQGSLLPGSLLDSSVCLAWLCLSIAAQSHGLLQIYFWCCFTCYVVSKRDSLDLLK